MLLSMEGIYTVPNDHRGAQYNRFLYYLLTLVSVEGTVTLFSLLCAWALAIPSLFCLLFSVSHSLISLPLSCKRRPPVPPIFSFFRRSTSLRISWEL
jgi:hypothetical protein